MVSFINLYKLFKKKIDNVIEYNIMKMRGKLLVVFGGYVKLSWKISVIVSSLEMIIVIFICFELLILFWCWIIVL